MTSSERPLPDTLEFDVVVVGAGTGGLTAALVASLYGCRVLLIEKSGQVGGTAARSSGTVWIPNNPDQVHNGIVGDDVRALAYLDALVGGRAPREMRQAFVEAGPELVRFLGARTDIAFRAYESQPDYRPELPGAALGGRALEPLPFDGRTLGKHFDEVASPLPELMLFGGMMITRGEAARLLRIGRSLDAFFLGLRLVLRFARDRLRHRRGTRLVLGNALVARLYRNVLEAGATVWLGASVSRLGKHDGRVEQLIVLRNGGDVTVRALRGIVLAGGGFPAGREWRERYLPAPVAEYTTAAETCTGETIELGLGVGGVLGPPNEDNALWFPSSIAKRRDGSLAVYPHIVLDRGKPGLVAVNAAGRRFVDEAAPYHEFTRAMYRSHQVVRSIPAYLVCNRRFIWKYGLGLIRPRTPSLRGYIASGYLRTGGSIEQLASAINVDAEGLAATVRAHNEFARTGVDRDFGKGSNPYDHSVGDPEHHPNPCLGPLERPPYFAVAVYPTPLGTSLGLLTDSNGQAIDADGAPIAGLYVCGNDMHSPFGGEYPGAGSQIGLSMVFGYLGARHAAMAR